MATHLVVATLSLLVAAGAGPWLALPATAAPVYRAFVNIDNVSCSVCNDQEFTVMDDRPVEAEATGQFNVRRGVARAKAGPGFLEAFGSAQNQGNPNPFSSPIVHTRFASSASVNADLFFSSPPGSTVEEIPTRLNMHLAGVFGFNAANDDAQTAGVTVEFTLPGRLNDGSGTNAVRGEIEIIRADGVTTEIDREGLLADVQAVDETDPMGDFARVIRINANITTPEFVIPMNVPTTLGISIFLGGQQSSSLGFGSLSADFERTLRFANDRPVFNLPAGYTANSAALGIVDNQYVVPEPATAVLLGLLIVVGLVGVWRSRCRQYDCIKV
jgi:hypothetical protein